MKSYILLAFVLGSLSAVCVDARRSSKAKKGVPVSEECMKKCSHEREDTVCGPNGDIYKNKCEFFCEIDTPGVYPVKPPCAERGTDNKSDRDSSADYDDEHHTDHTKYHGGFLSGLLGGSGHHNDHRRKPCLCDSREKRRVCGSDGTFYINQCYMNCKSTKSSVRVVDDSRCEKYHDHDHRSRL